MKRFPLFLILISLLSCAHLKDARHSFESGDYNATIKACQTAIHADSTDAEAYFLLGQSYSEINDLEKAEIALGKAFELEPESQSYKRELSKIFLAKGDLHFAANEYYVALEEYEKALKLYPNDAKIIEKIGDTYFQAGKHDRAREEYEKFISVGGDSSAVIPKLEKIQDSQQRAQVILAKGRAELDKKHYDKAKALFAQALKIKPDLKEGKYYLHIATGLRLYKKGSKSALWDAILEFGQASALRPKLAEPHYFMAMAYEKKDRNEFDNAVREYEAAAELEPDSKLAKKSLKRAKKLKARHKKLKDFWGK